MTNHTHEIIDVQQTTCCIVGGGPAGIEAICFAKVIIFGKGVRSQKLEEQNRHLQKRSSREQGEIIDNFWIIIDSTFYFWRCLIEKKVKKSPHLPIYPSPHPPITLSPHLPYS